MRRSSQRVARPDVCRGGSSRGCAVLPPSVFDLTFGIDLSIPANHTAKVVVVVAM
jgi:hypothetical protein